MVAPKKSAPKVPAVPRRRREVPVDANVQLYDAEMGVTVINETDISTRSVYEALVGPHPEMAALIRWTLSNKGSTGGSRKQSIFSRDRYVTPQKTFDQFDTARDAVRNDDVVAGVMESTESLSFGRLSFMCDDADEEDIWDQISFDLDLETRIREMWRELFICSQFYAVTWYGQKDYKVRGKTDKGIARKRQFNNLTVPLGITLLDPKKVTPVGNLMFGQEQLAYIADRSEVDMLDAAVLNDPEADPVSRQIIVGKYAPPDFERRNLANEGINPEFLYILNPRNCWKHTLTRTQFQRFADVRMVSVFELLDLKHQLRQMDRTFLLGGSNYIMLLKKGTEQHPAKPGEVDMLREQVTTIASVPIIVGDHRLAVEIITPKTDNVLSHEKYGTIDSRINARLYQMFLIHSSSEGRGDDSMKVGKVISRGLESRRYSLRRTLERQVFAPTVELNEQFTSLPKMRFHPTRIQLDFDPAWVQLIMDVRARGDISRDTMLNEMDYEQEDEARLRAREEKTYDKVFTPVQIPFDSPAKLGLGSDGKAPGADTPGGTPGVNDPRSGGRQGGGLKNGGGRAPGTGQGTKKDLPPGKGSK